MPAEKRANLSKRRHGKMIAFLDELWNVKREIRFIMQVINLLLQKLEHINILPNRFDLP